MNDSEVKRTHYSNEELDEFRELILDKLVKARYDLEFLTEAYTNSDSNDVMSKEENAQLAGRLEKFIQSLENALVRIKNKSYGICPVTGKLLSKERLRLVPHATRSLEAKLNQEQELKQQAIEKRAAVSSLIMEKRLVSAL